MEPVKPHASALRKGRYSAPGLVYFITTNVERKQALIAPSGREVVIATLRWSRDNRRIWSLGYVVLDNHLHTMFILREGYALSTVMMSLKRHTAREINKLLGRAGEFWQAGYHDHAIRDETDFWNHYHYMHNNPVRCGWAEKAEDYLWSTAGRMILIGRLWDISRSGL
jgi:REP element-mobilizing transposase RayT